MLHLPLRAFLQINDLSASSEMVQKQEVDFVYPVVEYSHPIQRAMMQLPGGRMQFFAPENELKRTQDLEKSFHDAGQFYWGKASAWTGKERMHGNGFGMVIPNWRVVDIDNEDDWRRAELMFHSIISTPKPISK